MNKDISTEITPDGDVWIELAGNRARLEKDGIVTLMDVLAQALAAKQSTTMNDEELFPEWGNKESAIICAQLSKFFDDDDEDVSDIMPDEIADGKAEK